METQQGFGLPNPPAKQTNDGGTAYVVVNIEEPTEVSLVRCNTDKFAPDFHFWLLDNFAIWRRFKREADLVWQSGRRHYSARTIGEFIRHQTALRDSNVTFKCNDHVWPDCARLWLLLYPERKGFFDTRVQLGSSKRLA
jgi:hypothetical protein